MHEMSLCESLIETIQEQAEVQQFGRVKTVFLEIGMLAGVETDALRFCFDIICRGTVAESAQLVISEPPGRAWCFDCNQEVQLADRLSPCPICHGYSLQYKGGDEMRITELEVY